MRACHAGGSPQAEDGVTEADKEDPSFKALKLLSVLLWPSQYYCSTLSCHGHSNSHSGLFKSLSRVVTTFKKRRNLKCFESLVNAVSTVEKTITVPQGCTAASVETSFCLHAGCTVVPALVVTQSTVY